MNELDNFEKYFKDSVGEFSEEKPSDELFSRVEYTLRENKTVGIYLILNTVFLCCFIFTFYFLSANKIINNTNQLNITESEIKSEPESVNKNQNLSETSNINKAKVNKVENKNISTEKSNLNNISKTPEVNKNSNEHSSKNTKPQIDNSFLKSQDSENHLNTKINNNLNTSATKQYYLQRKNKFSLNFAFSKYISFPQTGIINVKPQPVDPINYNLKDELKLSAEVVFGYSKVNNTLSPQSSDIKIYESLNQSEYGFGVNLRLSRNAYYLQSGLYISQFSEEYEFNQSKQEILDWMSLYDVEEVSYSYIITGYNTNQFGDSIPVIDVIKSTNTYTDTIKGTDTIISSDNYSLQNNHLAFEIPLIIGKEFRYKNLFLSLGFGVTYSRIINNKVQLINTDNLQKEIISTSDAYNLFNGIGQIEMAYRIFSNSKVFIRSEFKYGLNNIYDNRLNSNKSYNFNRYSIGFRYDL